MPICFEKCQHFGFRKFSSGFANLEQVAVFFFQLEIELGIPADLEEDFIDDFLRKLRTLG